MRLCWVFIVLVRVPTVTQLTNLGKMKHIDAMLFSKFSFRKEFVNAKHNQHAYKFSHADAI